MFASDIQLDFITPTDAIRDHYIDSARSPDLGYLLPCSNIRKELGLPVRQRTLQLGSPVWLGGGSALPSQMAVDTGDSAPGAINYQTQLRRHWSR